MSRQQRVKSISRKRLFGIFSKQTNGVQEKTALKVKSEFAAMDSDPADPNAAPNTVFQSLVDSLAQHKSDLRFSVYPLHDSIVQYEAKNCFQVSTFFPTHSRVSTRASNGFTNPRRDALSSPSSQRRPHESYRSKMNESEVFYDEEDDEESRQSSVVCLRRPAQDKRAQASRVMGEQQEPHSVHRIYSCRTPAERNYWLNKFRCVANPNLSSERSTENHLHLCIQEIKGVPAGNEYFCEIYLDDALYAQTSVKAMTESLSWSEDYHFSYVPPFGEIRVLLWMLTPNVTVEKMRYRRASIPRFGILNGASSRLSTYRLSLTKPADSTMSVESSTLTSSVHSTKTENSYGRKRKRSVGLSSKKPSVDLFLIAKFVIPSANIAGVLDREAWYTSCLEASLKRRSFADTAFHTNLSSVSSTHSNASASVASFDGAVTRPASAKRLSASGLRLSRKTLNQLTVAPPRLRLTARLAKLTVLPVCAYSSLLRGLSNPTSCTLLLRRLEPWLSVKSKAALAKSLLSMLQLRSEVPAFLAALVLSEVQEQDNPNMVLRSNSLATKAIELYLKQVGDPYLKVCLGDFVSSVLSQTAAASAVETSATGTKEKRNSLGRLQTSTRRVSMNMEELSGSNQQRFEVNFEVDPDKVTNSRQLLRNQANLMRLVRDVWGRIQSTAHLFPNELRITFAAIREAMLPAVGDGVKSTRNESVGLFEHVVSACVFLRFICPAILSPSLFGLAGSFEEDVRAVRAFTLVAKTILNLANFTLFGDVKELHMDFLNRFVAEEMPKMRDLLWRLSEPSSTQFNPSGSMQETGPVSSSSYCAQLVDVLTVLKNPTDFSAEGVDPVLGVSETPTMHVDVFTAPVPTTSFCGRCSSTMLESYYPHHSGPHADIKPSNYPSSAISTSASSHEDLLRRQWMTELQDLQYGVSVCQQAVIGIPKRLTATERPLELEQLALAAALADCHAQLEMSFAVIPPERLDEPLKTLRSILANLARLCTSDSSDWHVGTEDRHRQVQPRQHQYPSSSDDCPDLVSSVSALSLVQSTPPSEERYSNSPSTRVIGRLNSASLTDHDSVKPEPQPLSPFTAKAKSTQITENQGSAFYRHQFHHYRPMRTTKNPQDSTQTLSSSFNTSSEPGPLYINDPVTQQTETVCSQTTTTTSSRATGNTNESSWSLLHANPHAATPSPATNPSAQNPTFYSDSSCASVTLPSTQGSSFGGTSSSSNGGGVGRPSNHPIMGTSLYSAAASTGGVMHRSCTFPVNSQQLQDGAATTNTSSAASANCSRLPQAACNPIYQSMGGRELVSVETQTSQEEVTELDEVPIVVNPAVAAKRIQRETERRKRHLYINILDEFDSEDRLSGVRISN